jgi:DNA-binding NarL/FixJ family response regulator
MASRIVIADDQALVRAGFRKILEAEPDLEVVAEATDGSEAVAKARDLRPDLVLMDIRMPGLDGIEATRQITAHDEDPPRVLMLTTFDLDDYVYDALRAGASGFLLKDAPPEDLIRAVQVVLSGEALLAPSVTRTVIEEFVASRRPSPALSQQLERLTSRERDVLQLAARGLSNRDICRRLFISPATTKTHMTHILAKLDLRDRVHAVVFAYESGLVQLGQQDGPGPGDPG